jgi:hypothetical protein
MYVPWKTAGSKDCALDPAGVFATLIRPPNRLIGWGDVSPIPYPSQEEGLIAKRRGRGRKGERDGS